jgi:hypothetical protein
LDTEWLLSTLFDASLLSTSKAAGNGGSFFGISCPGVLFDEYDELLKEGAGNHKISCGWTLASDRAMICSS